MDAVADAVAREETPQHLLQRLPSMTARGTACHDMYRFEVGGWQSAALARFLPDRFQGRETGDL